MKRAMRYLVPLLILTLVLTATSCSPPQLAGSQVDTAVYIEPGGDKLVVGSGGEIEVQSGATFDLQSGATTDFSSGMDLDGGDLTIDADGDSILTEASDDLVTFTPGAASGSLEIRTGNLQVGNGTPGETHDGEDFYVEGISEFDGAAYFDGAVDMDSTLGVAGAITLQNSEVLDNSADATFDFTRNDSGAVTLTCSDDDATCDIVYDAGGASGITVGSADVTAVTVTTDGTGDAEVALPENSVGPDEVAVMTDVVYFCGQQANNGTIYFGPVTAFLTGDYSASYVMGDAQCDALDNATEATADEPIGYANTAFKVHGMMCEASSSGSNGVAFTLRSAEADTTPAISCTVPTSETSCTSVTGSTTDIAAGATLAMQVVNTEDLSAQDGWCKVFVSYK